MNDDAHLDEIASAVLDGEATADERALVDQSPELAARVERLRALRATVAEVPPPEPARREQAIAAALAVRPRADATVTPLTVERARRRPTERTMRIAAIAAIVAVGFLVVSLVAVLATRDGADDADTFATGDAASDDAGDDADAAVTAELAPDADAAGAPGTGEALEEGDGAAASDAPSADTDDMAGGETADEPADDGAALDEEATAAHEALARELTRALEDLTDVGEVPVAVLVDLASPDATDTPSGIGRTDEAVGCATDVASVAPDGFERAVVATVGDVRVLALTTSEGPVLVDLTTCTVMDPD